MEKQLILNVYIEFYQKINKTPFNAELTDKEHLALKIFQEYTNSNIGTNWLFEYALSVFNQNRKTTLTSLCSLDKYNLWKLYAKGINFKENILIKKYGITDPNKEHINLYNNSRRYLNSIREKTAVKNELWFIQCLEMELYEHDNKFCIQCKFKEICLEIYGNEKMQKMRKQVRRKQVASVVSKVQPRKNLWNREDDAP